MDLALVVVPNPVAGLWEDGVDGQQEAHLRRLEDSPARIDQGIPLTGEVKTLAELLRGQVVVDLAQGPDPVECGAPQEGVALRL